MGDTSHQELLLLVGSIDGKVDQLLENYPELTKRLAAVERSQERITTISALCAAVATWLGKDHIAALLGIGGPSS